MKNYRRITYIIHPGFLSNPTLYYLNYYLNASRSENNELLESMRALSGWANNNSGGLPPSIENLSDNLSKPLLEMVEYQMPRRNLKKNGK
jgi:hypothetical protein